MNKTVALILLFFACFAIDSGAWAQETLAQKKERADQLFKDKNWIQAEALYGSIIADDPKNHDLNFRYGTCLLYGSKNKEEAIRRLRFAVTGAGIDNRAYYYLGRAYHLNYQFNDAIKQYTKFKQIATATDLKELDVEADLLACNFGKKLMTQITNLIVMEKTELKEDKFYDLYKLDDIGGQLIVTDIFQSKLDKKLDHRPIIHFPSNSLYIYYSSYGEDGTTGLDIYVKKKLPGGEWSEAQKIKGQVNTDQDENFAYMHPNGEYLYFCSKGHNTMGGYDVFRSRYNEESNSFGPPENLDFVISSPDDDLLFVVDSLDRTAYFASSRESGQGYMTVYKVRVDRVPMQMAVIKGNFLNTIDANEKEVTIEVEDFSSGAIIGTFNSKQTNGDYIITFPKAGKYNYYITPKNSDITHKYTVDVPATNEFKPLKQSMNKIKDENGEELIIVTDLFNEEFDDPVGILAEVFRELSKLNPNAQDFDLDSLDATQGSNEVFTDVGLDATVTQEGLQSIVEAEIADLEAAKLIAENQSNIAYNLAAEKSELANAKMVELNTQLNAAEQLPDGAEKTKALQQILKDKKAIEDLNNEAQSLINLAKSIDQNIKKQELEIVKATNVLNQVKAVQSDDRGALAEVVKTNSTYFKENVKDKSVEENPVTTALRAGADEQKKVQSLSEELSNLNKEKRELEAEMKRLDAQIAAESKQKVIDELEKQKDALESEIAVVDQQISSKSVELEKQISDNEEVRNGLAAALILKDDAQKNNQSLTDSEKKEIASQVQKNDLAPNLALVDEVLEKNKVSAFNIELYANNETTSKYSLEDWDEAISKEQERLRLEKLAADEARQKQIQDEIDRLERLRQEKLASNQLVAEDPSTIQPEINQYELVENYDRRLESINAIVNEGDRRRAGIALNNEMLVALEKEKQKLEALLIDDPKAKNIKQRLDNVVNLQNSLVNQNKSDQEWILANDNQVEVNADQILADLDPNYQEKVNDAYSLADPQAQTTAIRELNEALLEKANERIQELQAVIADDPSNTKANRELEYLNDFVDDLSQNKDQALVDPVKVDLATLSPTVEVGELVDNYADRLTTLQNLDEANRKKGENKLYQEVIDQARAELAELDRLAIENPGNKTILKRQEALRTIDRDYNKLIVKNDEWLAKNQTETTLVVDQETLTSANPNYQKEIDRINGIENKQEQEKAIENLNEATLDQIEKRIEELTVELKQNPSNADASAERNALEELQITIEKNKSTALVQPTDLESLAVDPNRTDLFPTFDQELKSIDQSGQTDEEKQAEKIRLNEELLEIIGTEIDQTKALQAQNPTQSQRLDERLTNLEQLATETEKTIEALKENPIENTLTSDRAPISEDALMPSYKTDLQAITSSDKSEKDKLIAENDLHKMMIGSLEWKIKSLEDEREEDPTLSDQINAEIKTLETLKAEKEGLIAANDKTIAALPDNVSRPVITSTSLMRDYDSKRTDIRNGSGTETEKLAKENEIHAQLIAKADERIRELEAEKLANPAQAAAIDADIEKVKDIKRRTQSSININEDLIAQSGNNELKRPIITIGSLVSDFESRAATIENSKANEAEKLEQKNQLNKELVTAIEAKIVEIQEEWEEDPANGFTYNEEINKLEELKESVRSEMARNREEIADLESGQVDVASLSPTDFDSQEGQETVKELNRELTEIKAINSDIAGLNDQLNATDDPAEKEKIQKSIDKLEKVKAGLENEVIEGLAEVNNTEVEAAKSALEIDQKLTENANAMETIGMDEEVKLANENMLLAEQKMKQAAKLRAEAENEKDVLLKNDKLTAAFELETEAKSLITKAQRTYKMARVGVALATEDEIIMDVPDNVADRKSTALMDEAAQLREEANAYYDRAKFLRDSSETVKEKFRAPILNEADAMEMKGDLLSNNADDREEKAEEIKAKEDELLAVKIDTIEKAVNASTAEKVAATEEYKAYTDAKNEGDKNTAEIEAIQTTIDELKEVRTRKFKQAISGNSTNPAEEIENDDALLANQAKIDSLTAIQNKLRDEALANYEKAREILNAQSADQQENMMALEQEDVKPYIPKVQANVDFEIPTVLETDIFRTTTDAVYSEEFRIPVSNKQPSGLVYKVQVGAFRNPLPQDHFKEFAPISGEKLNNGITRFMVGYFTTFSPASDAKGKVNNLGYSDAFVVAYCNGERITVDRARLIEQGLIECNGTVDEDQLVIQTNNNNSSNNNNNTNANNNTNNTNTNTNNTNTNANNNTNNNNTNNNNTSANNNTNNNNANNNNTNTTYSDQSRNLQVVPTTAEERELASYYTSVPNAAKAGQVELIKGLFYTVQIGVYSKPVPNSALFNIQPLNSQRTPTGFVRYSTGIFTSVEDATARKNEIVQIGVADAFVTAYFNGERITVEEALVILKRDGAAALVGRADQINVIETNVIDETPEKEQFFKEGLYYRILLGKYEDAIPGEYATLLLRGDDLIETEVDEDGLTVVFSNKLNSYEDMIDRLSEFADLGVEDMDVITYYKYDVIPFEEGEKIRKGEPIDEINPLESLEGVSANDYIYSKEAVYFKIKLGEFEDKISTDFTNLFLQYEESEGIEKEETLNDETVFYTGSIETYAEAEARRNDLKLKGFDRAIIVAYHKYDEISIDKAREILGE